MKKFRIFLVCAALLCLMMSVTAYAQDRVIDYFYPEGHSSYYTYKGTDKSPMEKISVQFERAGQEFRMEEDPPIPLIGGLIYKNGLVKNCYSLDISDTAVTAKAWWTRDAADINNTGSRNRLRYNIVLLRLPDGNETVTWSNTISEGGTVQQIWEMSAKRLMIPFNKNGIWVAAQAIEVKRNVFDPQHNPLPGQSTVEYWQKGLGKVKVIKVQ